MAGTGVGASQGIPGLCVWGEDGCPSRKAGTEMGHGPQGPQRLHMGYPCGTTGAEAGIARNLGALGAGTALTSCLKPKGYRLGMFQGPLHLCHLHKITRSIVSTTHGCLGLYHCDEIEG